MAGLLNQNPYGRGLLNQPLTFSAMYPPSVVNAQNPLPSYSHLGKPMPPDMAPTQIVKGILGGMGSLAMQANEAMPWGGNNPQAIGYDPQAGTIDPSVMVPFATDVAGMATTGSLAAPAVGNGLGMGIRAYHGSPHDFDRFSMDKIGTGEGNQTYGHGLYFAENEGVAKTYRDILGYKHTDGAAQHAWDNPQAAAGYWLRFYGGDKAKAREYFESLKRSEQRWLGTKRGSDAEANIRLADGSIAALDAGTDIGPPNPGKMYEVDINASPDEFLDYGAPLDRQSPKVKQVLEGLGVKIGRRDPRSGGDMLGEFGDDPAAASQALRDAGIKGIRYEDAGSRFNPDDVRRELASLEESLGSVRRSIVPDPVAVQNLERQIGALKQKLAQPQTANLVVFDDSLIDILKKYGIAGLTAGGAGAAMLGGSQDASAAPASYSTGGRF